MSIQLGIVPYLNTLPLLEGLEETFPRKDWVRATPRELGRLLEEKKADIAEVSTFEGLRRSDALHLLPGAAIGSDGPVRSVALYSKTPLEEIKTVLHDCSSLTSTNLVRILLKELYGIDPARELSAAPIPADFQWQTARHDAFLVIGDAALQWEGDFPHKLDLGEGWKQLTGLPFVYAGWWARREVALTDEQIAAFANARKLGEQRIDTIISRLGEETIRLYKGRESLRQYFTEAIRYGLGERAMKGLGLFGKKLREHNIL